MDINICANLSCKIGRQELNSPVNDYKETVQIYYSAVLLKNT